MNFFRRLCCYLFHTSHWRFVCRVYPGGSTYTQGVCKKCVRHLPVSWWAFSRYAPDMIPPPAPDRPA